MIDEYVGSGKYKGKGNRAAYLIALEHALDTDFHGVLKGKAPKGAVLRLAKKFQSPTWDGSFADFVDTTLTVGGNGRFSWIVNPSTRPVVASHAYEAPSKKPFKAKLFESTLPPPTGANDHEFVLTKAADIFDIRLDWSTPDDMDLEVYRQVGDKMVEVGSSGNLPGEKEQVTLIDAVRGTYVMRVVNYASASPTYTVDVKAFDSEIRYTKGKKESLHLHLREERQGPAAR